MVTPFSDKSLISPAGRPALSIITCLFVLLALIPQLTFAAPTLPEAQAAQSPKVIFEKGLLTVEANGVKLKALMGKISKKASIGVSVSESLQNEKVSVQFEKVDFQDSRHRSLPVRLQDARIEVGRTVADDEQPQTQRLADGVYAFIGVQGEANSGFIITEEGVVVIDSQPNPDLAGKMRAAIRKVTDKPILYLINTHHHGDHCFANHAFPEVRAIIAHDGARRILAEKGEVLLEQFTRFLGKEKSIGIAVTLPTLTFSERLTLRLGSRTIELSHPGVGHTQDDSVVWLPEEGILFGGDLVYVKRLPWLGDGETGLWLATLEKLKSLHPKIIVPGHGNMTDEEGLEQFKGYLTDLRAEVHRQITKGASLDEMKTQIKLPAYSAYLKYPDWLPLNIEKVYQELQSKGRALRR